MKNTDFYPNSNSGVRSSFTVPIARKKEVAQVPRKICINGYINILRTQYFWISDKSVVKQHSTNTFCYTNTRSQRSTDRYLTIFITALFPLSTLSSPRSFRKGPIPRHKQQECPPAPQTEQSVLRRRYQPRIS